jgi:hypothetical protein
MGTVEGKHDVFYNQGRVVVDSLFYDAFSVNRLYSVDDKISE